MIRQITWEQVISQGFKGISGTEYQLESELSVDRYAKMQEYLVEVASNMSAADLMRLVGEAYQDLQHPKLMDAGFKLRKILDFGSKVVITPHPVLKACAMFINRKEDTMEQRIAFSEVDMMQKCDDWRDIGMESFFALLGSFKRSSSQSFSGNSVGSVKEG